jgi:hypothetical protein
MLTMDDLTPQIIEVSIRVIEGDASSERVIPLAVLSWSEWSEIGLAVDDPLVPDKPKVVDGKKRYVLDRDDPDYRRELVDAANERSMRRLARSLVLAGNFDGRLDDLPVDEQAAAVGKLPNGLLMGLNAAMNRIHRMSHSEVMAKSKNFLGVSDTEGVGEEGAGVEPVGVAGVSSNGAG